MKKQKSIKKHNRFPDYDRVDTKDAITFGTTIFIRKDKRALKIVFPTGTTLDFMPEEEIKIGKNSSDT